VIVDQDGNLATLRGDGSDLVALTSDASATRQFGQPTWSPDGTRIAWIDADLETGDTSLIVASFDGPDQTATPTRVGAFYLYWNPTGDRIAYLGNGESGFEVGILDATDRLQDAAVSIVDSGQPYYFDWSPDGERMLVHAGIDRLDFVGVDGVVESLDVAPGLFQSPNWSDTNLVYVASGADGQQLVTRASNDAAERTLFDFDGLIQFSTSPDGASIAFQIRTGTQPIDGGISALRSSAPLRVNQLAVIDLDSGLTAAISPGPSLAFYWGPNGQLLSLHQENTADGEPWFRWRVFELGDGEPFEGDLFRPSPTFAQNYLPFFNQYSLSMSPWEPDGSAFTYPGSNQDGERGIWVQELTADRPPVLISDGVFSAWSQG
jgi:hypothetical protein